MTKSSLCNVATTYSGHVVGGCNGCGTGIALPARDTPVGIKVECPGCLATVVLAAVRGIMSDEACNSLCMYARGPDCECNCGGHNHGAGYMTGLLPTWNPTTGARRVVVPDVPATIRERNTAAVVRRDGKREAKRVARVSKADAARRSCLNYAPEIGEYLSADWEREWSDFEMRVHARFEKDGGLSDAQLDAIVRTVQRVKKRAAQRAAWDAADDALRAAGVRVPVGRLTFTGTIVAVSRELDPFKYHEAYKTVMTVRHADGWRVRGTLPAWLEPEFPDDLAGREAYQGWTDRVRGQTVTMVATLDGPADRVDDPDVLFGYFKRPTAPKGGGVRLSAVGPEGQTAAVGLVPVPSPVMALVAVPADDEWEPSAEDWAGVLPSALDWSTLLDSI